PNSNASTTCAFSSRLLVVSMVSARGTVNIATRKSGMMRLRCGHSQIHCNRPTSACAISELLRCNCLPVYPILVDGGQLHRQRFEVLGGGTSIEHHDAL